MLWPKTLTVRLVLLMLVTLLLVQCVSVVIYLKDRNNILSNASASLMIERIAALVRLIDQAEPFQYEAILNATQNGQLALRLSQHPIVATEECSGDETLLQNQLYAGTGRKDVGSIRVSYDAKPVPADCDMSPYQMPGAPEKAFFLMADEHQYWQWSYALDGHQGYPGPRPFKLTVAVQLATGDWLNIRAGVMDELFVWDWRSVTGLMLIGVVVIGLMLWLLRSHTRPLRQLADAADQISRGIDTPPLEEAGSAELSRTIVAFNRMQASQRRFIKDRMLMLAAISHDLRTPLTKLRLQTEFIDDAPLQQQQQNTLLEMDAMLNATMAFARDQLHAEQNRPLDLVSLIESICDDLDPTGKRLQSRLPAKEVYDCKPMAVRRMLTNVLENGLKYAKNVDISLKTKSDQLSITITDDGPGIPDDKYEQVFTPFFRLEGSRNRATGGMGLGLSIVRSVALLHGGEVQLDRAPQGGLLVEIVLPVSAD